MKLEITLLLLPLVYNVISYSENVFADVYIPYINYGDTAEIPFKYLVSKNTTALITIKAVTSDFEIQLYSKERSSENKEYIRDVFILDGDLFRYNVTFKFEANISDVIYKKQIRMPYLEKTTYDLDGELSIDNHISCGLDYRGVLRQMDETINISYVSSSDMKFDLNDFTLTYINNRVDDIYYTRANLKIVDKSNVFSYIAKEEDVFNIPLELAIVNDDVTISFQESVYLDKSSFSTYLDYKEGLISQNRKLYFPFDRGKENSSVEVFLTIDSLGYGNSNIVFYKEYYFSSNTMGLCATSEVCIKHV